ARVYAFDVSVRAALLDATRGYFNGPSVFLAPEGHENAPCLVEIVLPEREPFQRWRIATTMRKADSGSESATRFCADSYDELIDHPVEMSEFDSCAFKAGGVPHEVVVAGRQDADLDRLSADLARVCQWQIDLFDDGIGGAPPFASYLFQVNAVGDGYGG